MVVMDYILLDLVQAQVHNLDNSSIHPLALPLESFQEQMAQPISILYFTFLQPMLVVLLSTMA